MSKKSFRQIPLEMHQAAVLQEFIARNETHFQIKKTTHKPLGRQAIIDGEQYAMVTRLASNVDDKRLIYVCDTFVKNRAGDIAPATFTVERRPDQAVAEALAFIKVPGLLAASAAKISFNALSDLARQTSGWYSDERMISTLPTSEGGMRIALHSPTLYTDGHSYATVAFAEEMRVGAILKDVGRHQVIQNTAVWNAMRQHMPQDRSNRMLDPTRQFILSRGNDVNAIIDNLAEQDFEDLVVSQATEYRAMGGVVRLPGVLQPFDFEAHLFITMMNKQTVLLVRITGINTPFTFTLATALPSSESGRIVITHEDFKRALELARDKPMIQSFDARTVTDEQRIAFVGAYGGVPAAPRLQDFVPFSAAGKAFLVSNPSMTLFDETLKQEPCFTSFIATPHGTTMSLAAILTSNNVSKAKANLERIAKSMGSHMPELRMPEEVELDAPPHSEQLLSGEGVKLQGGESKPEAVWPFPTGTDATPEPSSGVHLHEEDWAVPLLAGEAWPRAMKVDVTSFKYKGTVVYLALLVPRFESLEKSINYLASDYMEAAIGSLIQTKLKDSSQPYMVATSLGEAMRGLEITFQNELRVARDSGDEGALNVTADALLERIKETFKTIVDSLQQAMKDGQVARAS